jgi:hypothetical protein
MINNKRLTIPTSLAVDMDAGAPTGITVAHSTEYDLGSTSFSLPFDITADDWTPGAEQWIYLKKQDANNYWGLKLDTGGTLTFIAVVASATILSVTSTAAISAVVGQSVFGAVAVTRESASTAGSAVFIANGAQLGTSVAITAGTAATISNTGILYFAGTDAAGSAMIIRAAYIYNRALSVAEVTTLRGSGVATADAGASNSGVAVTNGDFETWGSATNPTTWLEGANVSASISQVTGGGQYAGTYSLQFNGTGSPAVTFNNGIYQGGFFGAGFVGKKIRIGIAAKRASGTADLYVGQGSSQFSTIPGASITTSWSMFSVEKTVTDVGGNAGMIVIASGGNVITVDSYTVTYIGNTLSLPPTGLDASGTAWTDASGNGNSATLPASGATKIAARK